MKKQKSGRPNNKSNFLKTSSLYREKAITFFISGIIATAMFSAILPSCKNDVQTVLSTSIIDTLPEMTAKDIEILYSEKARVQIKLTSPLLVSKTEDEPVLLFPKGFTVFFYDSAMNLKSTITAEFGISYEKKKLMEAKNNVVVENLEKGEKLNTEQLFWDRDKQLIYSNSFVKLTSSATVIMGDGLTSREPFEELIISHPSGPIEIKEEPQK
jgi:LPS export ABC transporter protein LptC